MDTRTGDIMEMEELKKTLLVEEFAKHAKEVDVNALSEKRRRELQKTGRTKVGRNEPCPCGSNLKFKKCCLR